MTPVLARVFEMIGRQRSEFGRERGAARIRELVGVELDRQPVRPRGGEDAPRLLRRETDRLAEGVDGVGEARARDGRNRFLTDELDVGVATTRKFRGQRVRREQGRAHVDADVCRHGARGLQHPPLGRRVEPVARLDLDRRHAFGRERREPRPALRDERVGRRGARRTHRRRDAAARTRDLRVGRAFEAALEFVRAVAGVDEVRVAVDETRRDPAAAGIERARSAGDAPAARASRRPRRSARRRSRARPRGSPRTVPSPSSWRAAHS